MNKYLLYASSLGIFLTPCYVIAEVPIYITAKVIEKSCTIINKDIIVDMGVVDAKGIALNAPFAHKPFSISLNNCPASTLTAHVKLTTKNGASKFIENDVEQGNAKGYAIVVYNSANQELDMQDNSTDFVIDPNSAQIDLGFIAAFIKTSNTTSAGVFHAVASFEIVYD